MRKKIKQYVSMLMVMLMAISAVVFCGAEKAYAGSFSGGYISLGADLPVMRRRRCWHFSV